MKKALMLASVASMIDQFNMDNIDILKKLGYSVDVVTNYEYGSTTSQKRVDEVRAKLEADGVRTIHLPIPRKIHDIKGIINSYKEVHKLCKENEYKLVHCHSPIGGVIARLGARSARKKYGTKVIYTAHGFHFFKGAPLVNWVIFYPIERLCARFTDCLITINKEDYERAKGFKAKRVEYVPGVGINTALSKELNVRKEEKLKEFRIANETVLLSVGELNDNKNHAAIISALKYVEKPVKYIICGKGANLDHLKNLTEKNGIEDKVIFAGYRNDINELLKCVNIFCLPSFREGLSLSLLEAMAAGLPVICSRIRGNTDLIDEGKGGFLVDPHDVRGFAAAINKMIQNKNEQIKMREYNLEKIQKFDLHVVMRRMEEIYETV